MHFVAVLVLAGSVSAQNRGPADEYFKIETEKIANTGLNGIKSGEQWTKNAPEYRRQLREMLGLDPWPEHTPLNPVITGTLDHEEFTVENLHFQSMPGLYVTGNLYLPKNVSGKSPAILYACGHGQVVKDGVSYGNKTHYQHHGAWFARHGYVCLVIDTIQLGEIQGMHHGTYRHGQWWWNSRGYTPAGVEAWNSIRAIDYLQSRPEVDGERIGMTGRSGGGVYTWWTAAIDERVKVAAPVAGITDLQNYVVDGAVEGHCDCMFMVNTYRWDYDQIAALVAPRPLLICNTDKDTIFPLDGVIRVYNETRRIYSLVEAEPNIGLLITEGPHADTQDLQVPVLRWFDRLLMEKERPIVIAAEKFFEPEQLKVFDQIPGDEIVTTIQQSFVPAKSSDEKLGKEQLKDLLREKVFAGWPATKTDPLFKTVFTSRAGDVSFQVIEFESQPGVNLKLFVAQPAAGRVDKINMYVVDETDWQSAKEQYGRFFGGHLAGAASPTSEVSEEVRSELDQLVETRTAAIMFAPRGIGSSRPEMSDQQFTHWRRRFMLLGQTLDGMRVWDILRAVQVLPNIRGLDRKPIQIHAHGDMAVNALLASLYTDDLIKFELNELPASFMEGPDYLNIMKYVALRDLVVSQNLTE